MRTVRMRGFTLVELALVVVVIGLLIALTIPMYDGTIRRTHALEARLALEHIANAQLTWRRDHGVFLACERSNDVPRATVAAFDTAKKGWKELGYAPSGAVRYAYEVVVEGDGFRATAIGDLDGDGTESRLTVTQMLDVQGEDELE